MTIYWLKGLKIPGQQGYYKDLKPILNRNHYDIIQALDDSQITTVLVSSYCKKRKIKFVLWQGMYENYPEKYKRIIQFLYDWLILPILRKNTDYCIAKTTSAKEYLESKKFRNIIVIPVALETANFENSTIVDYRSKLGIKKSKKILLYVGKVEERRKPLFCLEVYKHVKSLNDNACLVYVGKGPMLNEVHNYVDEQNIKDVYFIPEVPQSELKTLYQASEIFILPTRYEIFGMVLMEAMYFELPVITYKAAGPKDVIDNYVDGIIMNDFDAEKWANEIDTYIFKKKVGKNMGKIGSKKIAKKYLWPIIGRDYYDEYIRIINSK